MRGLGCLHFLDRDRSPSEIRSFYFGSFIPKASTARGTIAALEVIIGFVLLFAGAYV